VDFRTV